MTTVTMTGVDGQFWDLTDPTSPVQLVGGLGGLHLPASTSRWQTTARQSGRRWKDAVTDSRQFTMRVMVGDPAPPFRTGEAWRELDTRVWDNLRQDEAATLTVNGNRTLDFRLDDDNEMDFAKDPALSGKAVYDIACIADRPEWKGPPQSTVFSFASTPGADYYNGSSLGPPFVISAPALGRAAYVSNPGDLPTYPVWTITGGASAVRVGVGDRVITIPFAIQPGQKVIIDTAAATITSGYGDNLWQYMGSTVVDFAPLPPGDTLPIAIGMDSPSAEAQIQVDLVPLYRRAW